MKTYYVMPIIPIYLFIQKRILMLPVPINKIPQIHGAGVHIMLSFFPPE